MGVFQMLGSLGFRVVVKNIHEATRIYTKKAKKSVKSVKSVAVKKIHPNEIVFHPTFWLKKRRGLKTRTGCPYRTNKLSND